MPVWIVSKCKQSMVAAVLCRKFGVRLPFSCHVPSIKLQRASGREQSHVQDHVLVKGASWVLELSFGDGPRRCRGTMAIMLLIVADDLGIVRL